MADEPEDGPEVRIVAVKAHDLCVGVLMPMIQSLHAAGVPMSIISQHLACALISTTVCDDQDPVDEVLRNIRLMGGWDQIHKDMHESREQGLKEILEKVATRGVN